MSTQPVSYVTPEEYLEFERAAETKHEYLHGEIIAMAGGSPAHALIADNIRLAMRTRVDASRCLPFSSDARVCVRWGSLIAYPDVSVVCGPIEYVDDKRDTISNVRVIFEVLSPSTRNYDRGEKSRLYRLMPTLAEYLFIEQTPVEIEHYRRLPNGHWDLEIITDAAGVVKLDSIGCEIPVSEIYRDLDRL
jgi:Uma2 family endonuclease